MDTTTTTVRVGLNLSAAGARFSRAVKQAAGPRLRRLDITLRHFASIFGERKLTFFFVELVGTGDEIAEQIVSLLPMDRVIAGQYRVEVYPDNHIHALATGIGVWLVCEGELPKSAAPPPNPPGTPGTPSVEISRAA